ncbi:CARDB domain-containing protein [Saliphagus sp. GCM10025334]
MIGRGEERGVSTVVGAVLMLGILVSALALYQVNVVPDENQAVEHEHHQTVQGQLLDVRNGLVNAPDRRVGSYSVSLGTTYPPRSFTVNPPPSSGSLELVEANESIRLENVTVTDEDAADYWDGRDLSFETGGLVYQSRYSEYRNAPTVIYENSVLYNAQDGNQATLTGQRLIDGNTIQLVSLDGEYSSSRSGTVAVDFETVSASENAISLESQGNVTLAIPTTLSVEKWERLLEDEPRVVSVDGGSGIVQITLEDGDYQLQVAKVGLGNNAESADDGSAYLTVVDEPRDVRVGETTRMTVEVRDQYNNPVSSVLVNASTDGAGSISPENRSTGPNGRVTFSYEAVQDDGGKTVTLGTSFTVDHAPPELDGDRPENVTREVFVSDSSNAGGASGAVDIHDEIRENDGEFEVSTSDFDNLDSTTGGYLVVENESHEVTFDTVGEDTVTVTGLEFARGDLLTATLYEIDSRASELDTDATEVIGANAPFFAVEITDTNDPISEGDTLILDATVENTGENADTQDVTLDIGDGTYTETISVENLEDGGFRSISFEWVTQTGDAGEYTATVSSADNSHSKTVTVEESGQSPVVDSLNVTSNNGNSYNVNWKVSDPDGDLAQVTVELYKGNGDIGDSTTINVAGATASRTTSLSSGNAARVQLTVTDEKGDQTIESEPIN